MVTESGGSSSAILVVEQSEKLERYRQTVVRLLTEYAERSAGGAIRTVPIFDREHDRYQLLDMGWDEAERRVFQPVVQVDLIEGKVWIQENMTDWDVGRVLVEAEVERSEIVLGMHSKALRRFSEYAVE